MKPRLRLCVVLLILAVCAMGVVGCRGRNRATPQLPGDGRTTSAGVTSPDDGQPSEATQEAPLTPKSVDPEAAARAFTGAAELRSRADAADSTGAARRVYDATLPDGEVARVTVDSATGEVTGFVRSGNRARTLVLSQDEAKAKALAWVSAHSAGFDPGNMEFTATLIDDGLDGGRAYRFRWASLDPASGALLPQAVQVLVNPESGEIVSYDSVRQPITVATIPSIDRQKAIGAALAALGSQADSGSAKAVLLVGPVPGQADTEQLLIWQVVVRGKADAQGRVPAAVVYVDANTGAVLRVAAAN